MKKYIRAEYFDKNGETAFQNIYVTDIKERSWDEILTCIEQRYFNGTDKLLIGLLNFRNISSWERFNAMNEDDIQKWIDNKNVDFIYFIPDGYAVPKNAKFVRTGKVKTLRKVKI